MASVSGRSVRRVITPAVVIGNGVLVNIFSRALSIFFRKQRPVDFISGGQRNGSFDEQQPLLNSSHRHRQRPMPWFPHHLQRQLHRQFRNYRHPAATSWRAPFRRHSTSLCLEYLQPLRQTWPRSPAPPPPSLPGSSTPVQCLPGTAPSFISTFSAPPSASVTSPSSWSLPDRPVSAVMALSDFPPFHEMAPVDPGPSTATVSSQTPSFGDAFVVGPGYAPIPPKLVMKIMSVSLSSLRTCWRTTSAPKTPSPTPSWTESLWSPPKRRECRRSATSPPG